MIASSLQTPPVGFEGELIIIPLVFFVILDFKSLKSGSYCLSERVLTKIGLAPVMETKSGKDTQYGAKIITSSPCSNKTWHALYNECLPPQETTTLSIL